MPAPIPLEQIEAARKDYREGKGSIPDIAARYGFSEHTLKQKATGQGWKRERDEYILKQRGVIESQQAVASLLPDQTTIVVNPQFFLEYGEKLYAKIATIADQVEEIDARLSRVETQCKDFCSYVYAKIALIDIWMHLQGVPKVAPRKVRENKVQGRSFASPIEPEATESANIPSDERPRDKNGHFTSQHPSEPASVDQGHLDSPLGVG